MKTGPSPVQFSTRTRLRPGGPTAPNLRSPLVMGHSTMRSNGSLPSGVVTITVFFYRVFLPAEKGLFSALLPLLVFVKRKQATIAFLMIIFFWRNILGKVSERPDVKNAIV